MRHPQFQRPVEPNREPTLHELYVKLARMLADGSGADLVSPNETRAQRLVALIREREAQHTATLARQAGSHARVYGPLLLPKRKSTIWDRYVRPAIGAVAVAAVVVAAILHASGALFQ